MNDLVIQHLIYVFIKTFFFIMILFINFNVLFDNFDYIDDMTCLHKIELRIKKKKKQLNSIMNYYH